MYSSVKKPKPNIFLALEALMMEEQNQKQKMLELVCGCDN